MPIWAYAVYGGIGLVVGRHVSYVAARSISHKNNVGWDDAIAGLLIWAITTVLWPVVFLLAIIKREPLLYKVRRDGRNDLD